MQELKRHAPTGRYRAPRLRNRVQGLSNVHRGRGRRIHVDVFDRDHPRTGTAHTFRWLLSTALAGAVGLIAIGVVIYGSLDTDEARRDLIRHLEESTRPATAPGRSALLDGLNWASPKSDRLQIASGALTERHVIHEQIQVRRDGKPYLWIRPYLRIVARLAPVPSSNADVIPPLNPLRLFASSATESKKDGEGAADGAGDVVLKVVDLLTGVLPTDDGLEIDQNEAKDLVTEAVADQPEPPGLGLGLSGDLATGLTPSYLRNDTGGLGDLKAFGPNITVLRRSPARTDDAGDDDSGDEKRVVRVGQGDTLARILRRHGAEAWQARAMEEAAFGRMPRREFTSGDELHLSLSPSPTNSGQLEPIAMSLFGAGHQHKVTVERSAGGTFIARDTPLTESATRALEQDGDDDKGANASVYASLYNAGLMQGLSPDTIMHLMRIHAYQTDFRRRVRNGDKVELFFDLKESKTAEPALGELLFTAIASGGDTQRYWRFRSSDGVVDYYDEKGQNSKQFLVRKPVRGADVRLTSGYGLRFHPLLNARRMHTGIDWAAPIGTPILAAGNGVVDEAKRHGQYGNHVRVRHANGYQTTYSHMSRFGSGIAAGTKVKQGQVLGYIGMTGLTSGPHLHFEVLVNNRFVDPLRLQVPRERHLTGKELAEFQKERSRIDDLMRRSPVKIDSR